MNNGKKKMELRKGKKEYEAI
jgi:hypothetical protein